MYKHYYSISPPITWFVVIVVAASLSLWSCKRSPDTIHPHLSETLQKAQAWYKLQGEQLRTNPPSAARPSKGKANRGGEEVSLPLVDSLPYHPVWQEAITHTLSDGSKVVSVPVWRYASIQYYNIGFVRRLVLHLDANNQVLEGQIVEFIGEMAYLKENKDQLAFLWQTKALDASIQFIQWPINAEAPHFLWPLQEGEAAPAGFAKRSSELSPCGGHGGVASSFMARLGAGCVEVYTCGDGASEYVPVSCPPPSSGGGGPNNPGPPANILDNPGPVFGPGEGSPPGSPGSPNPNPSGGTPIGGGGSGGPNPPPPPRDDGENIEQGFSTLPRLLGYLPSYIDIDPSFNSYPLLKAQVIRTVQTDAFKRITAYFANPIFVGSRKFTIKVTSTNRGSAQTEVRGNGQVIITLNANEIKGMSEAEIVYTILHEGVHARLYADLVLQAINLENPKLELKDLNALSGYFTTFPPSKYGGDMDYPTHNYIADKHLQDIVEGMKQYATGPGGEHANSDLFKRIITDDHYKALILIGLKSGFNPSTNVIYQMKLVAFDSLPKSTQVNIYQ